MHSLDTIRRPYDTARKIWDAKVVADVLVLSFVEKKGKKKMKMPESKLVIRDIIAFSKKMLCSSSQAIKLDLMDEFDYSLDIITLKRESKKSSKTQMEQISKGDFTQTSKRHVQCAKGMKHT